MKLFYNIKRLSMIHNSLLKFLKQNQNEQLNLCKFIETITFSFQIKPKSDGYQFTNVAIFHFFRYQSQIQTSGLLMFSGGIEVEHWLKMG